jgi:hypothetical protein
MQHLFLTDYRCINKWVSDLMSTRFHQPSPHPPTFRTPNHIPPQQAQLSYIDFKAIIPS